MQHFAPVVRAAPAGEEHVRPEGRIIAHPVPVVLQAWTLKEEKWREIQMVEFELGYTQYVL